MKTKSLYFLFFLTLVFSLIKVDYRFKEIPYGLEVDDAEYYYSAVTIGIDFDLDFSNQMRGVENRFLNFENSPHEQEPSRLICFSNNVSTAESGD